MSDEALKVTEFLETYGALGAVTLVEEIEANPRLAARLAIALHNALPWGRLVPVEPQGEPPLSVFACHISADDDPNESEPIVVKWHDQFTPCDPKPADKG